MNRIHVRTMLPTMQAFADGIKVEKLYGTIWVVEEDPDFAGPPQNWRIKPRPRHVWVLYRKDGSIHGTVAHKPDDSCYDAVEFVEGTCP